ncbi:MAG: lysophospholipid acyltransferase family protein [Acidobacteriota bacterium]
MASQKFRAFRSRVISRAIVAVSAIGRRLPLETGRRCGRVLGRICYHILPRTRRQALDNLRIAFPDWSDRQRLETTHGMFLHLGQSLFEIVWLPNMTPALRDQTTVIEGFEPLRALLEAGRGVIAFTGHCGNWEWLAYAVATFGYPVSVLQRERGEGELNQFITGIRSTGGIRTIDRGSTATARELIQAIRRGGFLAFLIDQNIRAESARINFFGRPALTPIGPARLAIRTEAVVVSAFIERRGRMQYIRILEPIECRRDDDPTVLTTRLTADIEEQIRRVPEQWVWMHDRWKERTGWDVQGD